MQQTSETAYSGCQTLFPQSSAVGTPLNVSRVPWRPSEIVMLQHMIIIGYNDDRAAGLRSSDIVRLY